MADENVELVRRAFAAWDEGDLATLAASYDPDVELIVVGRLNSGHYQGPAELVRWLQEEVTEVWDDFRYEHEELSGWGPHVIVRSHWHARSRVAGVPAEGLTLQIWTVHDGKIVKGVMFPSDEMSEGWGAGSGD